LFNGVLIRACAESQVDERDKERASSGGATGGDDARRYCARAAGVPKLELRVHNVRLADDAGISRRFFGTPENGAESFLPQWWDRHLHPYDTRQLAGRRIKHR